VLSMRKPGRPPAKKTLDKLTAVRLDPDQHVKMGEIAQELDRPIAWVIRRAITEYIERAGKK
jgi:predicted transcriptional regulator